MKHLKSLFVVVALLLGSVLPGLAQTATTFTTLSTALTDTTTKVVVLASGTGISASTASNQYYILIENELMKVNAISSATATVIRGYGGTFATQHPSGVAVIFGQPGSFYPQNNGTSGVFLNGNRPRGKCTAANSQYLPVVVLDSGKRPGLSNCNNGIWLDQTLPDELAPTLVRYTTVPVGSVAYASMGTSTTTVAGTTWFASVYVPRTMIATGISVLNGTTVGTDKWNAILYRADGVPIANSALAGATTVGANAFQDLAFTATALITGPARYWVAIQTNGTTDNFRSIATSTFVDVLGNSATGTFGTVINPITLPTTLTANKAPIAAIY